MDSKCFGNTHITHDSLLSDGCGLFVRYHGGMEAEGTHEPYMRDMRRTPTSNIAIYLFSLRLEGALVVNNHLTIDPLR